MDLAQILKVVQVMQKNPQLMQIALVFIGKLLADQSTQGGQGGMGGMGGMGQGGMGQGGMGQGGQGQGGQGQGGQGQGGQGLNLQDLLGTLIRAGMQSQVNSWLGRGSNQAVSGQQIAAAFSANPEFQQTLDETAQQTGVSQQEAADAVAEILPLLVDAGSPDGQLGDMQSLRQVAAKLFQPT